MIAEQSVISGETLVPITIAIALLLPVSGWLIWLNGRLQRIDSKLARIEALHSETWAFSQMEAWALRLKGRNPALDVPDPEPAVRPRPIYSEGTPPFPFRPPGYVG